MTPQLRHPARLSADARIALPSSPTKIETSSETSDDSQHSRDPQAVPQQPERRQQEGKPREAVADEGRIGCARTPASSGLHDDP
jgi:hypothetical protein